MNTVFTAENSKKQGIATSLSQTVQGVFCGQPTKFFRKRKPIYVDRPQLAKLFTSSLFGIVSVSGNGSTS